ncbi:MAG TPA: tetratricopeptide repeat protein [Candidatus Binatia bacterium]|nr:tetratricopeptide repeat protein [Candidatus Binatia bacterium]
MSVTLGVVIAVLALGLPALGFALWPLRRGRGAAALLPLPPDARERLDEDKRAALRALRELEFEHDAGHVSDADYADLRARYESETAAVLFELDRLGAPRAAPAAAAPAAPAPPRAAWRHPAAMAAAAVALVTFGVGLGVGIVRYTEPDPNAGAPMPGSRPLAGGGPMAMEAPTGANAPKGPVTPQVMQGMLSAARSALFAGQYNQAMQAYQAVLKRDPDNVDALTHMGLIAAIAAQGAEHGPEMVDRALGLFDHALEKDPNYAPALLYRGQVLYEVKKDAPGAIKSWEKFLAVTPEGEDRARVQKMIAEARAQGGTKAKP